MTHTVSSISFLADKIIGYTLWSVFNVISSVVTPCSKRTNELGHLNLITVELKTDEIDH